MQVPWVVLNELDSLKDRGKPAQSEAAHRALRRLRVLITERDSCVRGQAAAEHAQVSRGRAV